MTDIRVLWDGFFNKKYKYHNKRIMKAKSGDIIEFLAISWDVPEWEFDHPTAILKPYTAYSPNGESCEGMIEDMAINMCCGNVENEYIDDQLNWISTSLKTLNRVAKKQT